jgi:hypothetical protein
VSAVYCRRCGAENRNDAIHCVECGAALRVQSRPTRPPGYDDACFGLPHGGAIIGLIIGIFIIIAGISTLPGVNLWPWIWAIFLLVVGAAIVLAVLARLVRR